jgi:hypothetical protein
MSDIKKKELRKEVAEKFDLVPGFGIGEFAYRGRTYHMDQLTVAEVEELNKQGFKALKPKAAASATPATKP